MNLSQEILVFVVLAPGLVFGVLALLWLLGWTPGERAISKITGATFSISGLGIGWLFWELAFGGERRVAVTFGNWFAVHDYRFPLVLAADRLSLPFLAMTVFLSGLIGQFSATYLHRERGFFRFFLLLHLFAFGSLLAFAAGSFDLLAGGWEIVGITSVLLIGFFQLRPAPVENGLRVFAVYRACDIGLLVGVFAMHRWAGTSLLSSVPMQRGRHALIVCVLLVLAASGKAAQAPFSGWLPRAMEGPTPSSAIFYGAISIHAGAYLLLRIQPMLAQSAMASALVILIGAATALHGAIVGRASADAKTSLAYASLTQVGVMFVEIGFGWTHIAVAHILGHAMLRTLQFLRAPSVLHDYHQMRSAIGGKVTSAWQLEDLLPEGAHLWLYRWAFDRGHLDTILDRWVVHSLLEISRRLASVDRLGSPRLANRLGEAGISVRGPVRQGGD